MTVRRIRRVENTMPFDVFISYSKPGAFYGLIILMQAGLAGVFVAKDAFLFYVFYELALIPIFFIIKSLRI